MPEKTKIAIFASGRGSNAAAIIDFFKGHISVQVVLIVSNNAKAGVLDLGNEHDIETLVINRKYFYHSKSIDEKLLTLKVDLIVLAGFLWLIPERLIKLYPNRIINIHPALLPKYGGKGMYGHHVHESVKESGDKYSGITIHYVDENYDEGRHIFQKSCRISQLDSPEQIAEKVLKLEHHYFPRIIEEIITHFSLEK